MADKQITFEQAAGYGYAFHGARLWNTPETAARCAQDAALITTPNTLVPAEFTAYIDPAVIEILTAPRRARELFEEEKKGTWTTAYEKFRVAELVGRTEPYSDYSHTATSDVNNEWMSRRQYLFQTVIKYGAFEQALASEAKLSLASDKQRAAATRIDIDSNAFYLRGVAKAEIYGILNDPNLPSAITAKADASGNTVWADKDTKGKYEDVLNLFAQLSAQSNGLITKDDPLKLVMSPYMVPYLGSATDFNVNVTKMLSSFFGALSIVSLPEMHSPDGDETIMLIAPKVAGQKSACLAYSDKVRSFAPVQKLSSWEQKWMSTTYGGIVYQPFAFASMTGVA